ncbi:bacteriohemerythrin [Citrifermentans bremense]|uniref:bacteriohemerythrin n=1 Tax=Citrifermentans bremense TaxID=60035 RepID=UPI00047ED0E7|nr:hemerythrin domain-containing protein [Citrifermentans bremense]
MLLISWHADFSVGIPIIDEHNQQFIKLINMVSEQFGQGFCAESRTVLLKTVVSLSRFYFEYEERWMAKVAFPELSGHKRDHGAFMARILPCVEGDAGDDAQFLQFLNDWSLEHFNLHNPKVKRYVLEYGGRLNEIN